MSELDIRPSERMFPTTIAQTLRMYDAMTEADKIKFAKMITKEMDA